MALLIHHDCDTPEDQVLEVRLLSGFEVRSALGGLEFPLVGSRLIAYLALQQRPVSRSMVAGVLWPNTTQEKAQASLRSALWRVRRTSEVLIRSTQESLTLSNSAVVDVTESLARLKHLDSDPKDLPADKIPVSWFCCELLPDWYDDWVIFERERFRLAALHSLDRISTGFRMRGDFGPAAEYALLAIRLEPLRESSWRALVQTHVDQGNLAEALRQYSQYAELMGSELGIQPTKLMTDLMEDAGLGSQIPLLGG